ncbi:hypothetical protein [Actinomadura bangladeshensis]|uniref:Uncharacterized protein n=1 Tax=Actinomadura bangladeshensis TaxID=453573 RepID=A0A6L9Q8K1_9ACTN|nr:hypothetical protein [Actinomadura bangladeshensis]NEA21751.1 hypothetical protein [Actinomadura bangladeshensis]
MTKKIHEGWSLRGSMASKKYHAMPASFLHRAGEARRKEAGKWCKYPQGKVYYSSTEGDICSKLFNLVKNRYLSQPRSSC